jgi:uncharacterized protein
MRDMQTSSVFKNPSGERLDSSFHPAERRDTLVILGHGLTGNKDRPLLVALAEALSARGLPCMRISFSGNGQSQGRFEDATPSKEVSDLKSVLDVMPDYVSVAYIGHSMGAAVGVLTAATDLRIRALVSLAGMVRTADFVKREFGGLTPGRDCMWEESAFPLSENFVNEMNATGDVLAAAANVTQPWLLVHGTEDDLVPVQDSRDAFAASITRKKLVEIPGAGHSFDGETQAQVIEAVAEWLTACFA